MSVVLLDTTVASYLHPKKKHTRLRLRYLDYLRNKTLAVSFQTVAELWHWAERNAWSEKQRSALGVFVRSFIVIPYDNDLALIWAQIMNISRRDGRRLGAEDCWIAATALRHGIPLVTDDKDFLDRSIPGLQVTNFADT